MSQRSNEFAQRRMTLQLQCALQREQFADTIAQLGDGLKFMNRGLSMVRSTRIVPMILAAVSAAGVLSRAGGVLRLVSRGWLIFNTVQRLRRSRK
jgi:YqjK-like protein